MSGMDKRLCNLFDNKAPRLLTGAGVPEWLEEKDRESAQTARTGFSEVSE